MKRFSVLFCAKLYNRKDGSGFANPISSANVPNMLELSAEMTGNGQYNRNMKGNISMRLDDILRSQQESFEQLYQGQPAPEVGTLHQGLPAWEVGHPQPAFQHLVQQGEIKGPVLDVGCGAGETVLYLAEQGYEAWGVDFSPSAIQLAREKAAQRAVQATFRVGDALKLQALSSRFETIIDSGLFHNFTDEMRQPFVESLESVLQQGGHYYLLCFSDQPPLPVKHPRSISQQEIYETFQTGWHVQDIQPTLFIILPFPDGLPAWIATLVYTG